MYKIFSLPLNIAILFGFNGDKDEIQEKQMRSMQVTPAFVSLDWCFWVMDFVIGNIILLVMPILIYIYVFYEAVAEADRFSSSAQKLNANYAS